MAAARAAMSNEQATPLIQSSKHGAHAAYASKRDKHAQVAGGERKECDLEHVFKMFQCNCSVKISNVHELHEFEIQSVITVRQCEDVMSAKIGQLVPGSTVKLLQTGTALKRAKVWNERFGEGWISLYSPSGRCVIASKRAPPSRDHDFGANKMRLDLYTESIKAPAPADPHPKECKHRRGEENVKLWVMLSYEIVSPINLTHSENKQSATVAMLLPGHTVKIVKMGTVPGRAQVWNDTFGKGWINAYTADGRWCIVPKRTPTTEAEQINGRDDALSDAQVIKKAMRELKFVPKQAPPEWDRCKAMKKNVTRRSEFAAMALKNEL
jgi:hypothetical protein